MNGFAFGASFLGSGVEFVEALTIILAVGSIRGWKSSLTGAAVAIITLGVLVAIIGAPLVHVIHVSWVQILVGLFMLLFGIRWLRKAILRYAGLKSLHDEAAAYQKELDRQRNAGEVRRSGIDSFAFSTTFAGTFLEGLEAIFIIIAFGLSQNAIPSSIWGAAAAVVVVLILGFALRSPLARIPENSLKFIVGVMLTSFGAFWLGEGLHVAWPQKDLSIVYMVATLLVFSWIQVRRFKARLSNKQAGNSTGAGVSS